MARLAEAKRKDVFMVEPEDLTIITDDKHPLYDSRVKMPLPEWMILSVMEHGIRENIRAAKLGDQTIVIEGRQRVRAALEANKRLKAKGLPTVLVPTMVSSGETKELFHESVYLNEHRQDDDPLTRAMKAQRLLDIGYPHEDVANAFGVSAMTVRNWLKLFELDQTIRDAVQAGKINATSAIQLADLPVERQREQLAALLANGRVTVADAAKAAKGVAPVERVKRPSLKTLKALIESDDTPDDIRCMLRWITGEIQTATAQKHLKWLRVE